jgi:hypothetical protein
MSRKTNIEFLTGLMLDNGPITQLQVIIGLTLIADHGREIEPPAVISKKAWDAHLDILQKALAEQYNIVDGNTPADFGKGLSGVPTDKNEREIA